jgi:hypothetical protein
MAMMDHPTARSHRSSEDDSLEGDGMPPDNVIIAVPNGFQLPLLIMSSLLCLTGSSCHCSRQMKLDVA